MRAVPPIRADSAAGRSWRFAAADDAPFLEPNRRGTSVARLAGVQSDSETPNDGPQRAIIYRFSVNRGMSIALVIETPDWYSGLLQGALARVRIEGQNSPPRPEPRRTLPTSGRCRRRCASPTR